MATFFVFSVGENHGPLISVTPFVGCGSAPPRVWNRSMVFKLFRNFLQEHFIVDLVELGRQDALDRVHPSGLRAQQYENIQGLYFYFGFEIVHQRARRLNYLLQDFSDDLHPSCILILAGLNRDLGQDIQDLLLDVAVGRRVFPELAHQLVYPHLVGCSLELVPDQLGDVLSQGDLPITDFLDQLRDHNRQVYCVEFQDLFDDFERSQSHFEIGVC